MKNLLITLSIFLNGMAAVVYADNLPIGNYAGDLTESTSSWTWSGKVDGITDNNSVITVNIPRNPHLLNLKGTLIATVTVNGKNCSSPDGKVKLGFIHAGVNFKNCSWDGHLLTTDYSTASILGLVISGHASLSYIQ